MSSPLSALPAHASPHAGSPDATCRSCCFGPVEAGTPPHRVTAFARTAGADILVSIEGGTAPHIGATALATPSEAAPEGVAVHVTELPGHKDGIPARRFAERLCRRFSHTVCVCAGLHVDRASAEDIRQLLYNADSAMSALENIMTEKAGLDG